MKNLPLRRTETGVNMSDSQFWLLNQFRHEISIVGCLIYAIWKIMSCQKYWDIKMKRYYTGIYLTACIWNVKKQLFANNVCTEMLIKSLIFTLDLGCKDLFRV